MNTTRVALAAVGSHAGGRGLRLHRPGRPVRRLPYGILNISAQLAVFMALAGLGEWLLVGSVIGLVYKRPGV